MRLLFDHFFLQTSYYMDKKTCTKCLTEKEVFQFSIDHRNKSGKKYISKCKSCISESNKNYRLKNKERIANKIKEYIKNNSQHLAEYAKQYRQKNKESLKEKRKLYNSRNSVARALKQKEYYKKNLENYRKYRQKNKEKISLYAKNNRRRINDYYNKKRKNDFKYRLDKYISCAIRNNLLTEKISKNNISWENLVGYSREELIKHLETKFTPEMNWANYGNYWHIDHIKPKSWFSYSSVEDEQFKKCWALENLQPLEASKNLSKGNRYEG